ncbi:MAG: hypothetical protein IJB34_06640 [Clostridia bacterium]|nr:hypothetical protein [Clostridia bacterium]
MDDDISLGACIGFGLAGFAVAFVLMGFIMDWTEWGSLCLCGIMGFSIMFSLSANRWLRTAAIVVAGLGWTAVKFIFLHFFTGNPIDFLIGIFLVSFVLSYAFGVLSIGIAIAVLGGMLFFPFVFIIKLVRSARGY